MIRSFLALTVLVLCGCDHATHDRLSEAGTVGAAPADAIEIPMAHAETFSVYARDGYRIVDLSAPVVTWGGDAIGDNQTARIVLVPRDQELPPLSGDLDGAVLIRTPVERIAVNYGFLEALVTALEVEDRLVAVGGTKSYNDTIRERTMRGELAQIGYGWHMPPMIDPLVNAEPDVLFMVLGSLEHADHYERIQDLGIPVVPVFFEAETSYMGPVDYLRLVGMMTGKESEADAFVEMVGNNVQSLRASVETAPRKRVLSSWYSGGGKWMVTVRNADNALLEDAGGINPLKRPDDIRQDDFVSVGTEVLLENARDVDCWIIRDTHSAPFDDTGVLQNFKAWQEGCLFAGDGRQKPDADAFDLYETGPLRPDLLLGDMIRMLHPDLREEPFIYIRPDQVTPRP